MRQPFWFKDWDASLIEMLTSRSIYQYSPVTMVVHYACARPQFTDRGKSTLVIPTAIEDSFDDAINYVTANWANTEKARSGRRT